MTGYERFRAALEHSPIALPEATPEPRSGQIWRAAWDETTLNVYVDEANDFTVVAAPITADVALVDNPRFLLEGGESPVGYDAVVWRTPRLSLPRFVLDGCYGAVPTLAEEPIEPIVELSERARQSDPGWRMRNEVQGSLSQLANETWIPATRAVGPIRRLLQRASVSARDVIEELGLSVNVVAQLMDGSWWIDDEAVAGLVEILGVPADELPSHYPFEGKRELLFVVNTPRRRRQFRDLALGAGVSESKARLETSLNLLGVRTRQTPGEVDAVNMWNQLLDGYLDRAE